MKSPEKIEKKLQELREEIDSIDRLLLAALKTRFKIVIKIAGLKNKIGLPFYQKKRWEAILEDRVVRGQKMNLSPGFTRALLKLIHKESIRLQKNVDKED